MMTMMGRHGSNKKRYAFHEENCKLNLYTILYMDLQLAELCYRSDLKSLFLKSNFIVKY